MYKALYDGLFIGDSPIAGQGLFTKKELDIDTELGLSHVLIDEEIIRTPMGGFINHSENPNCEKYLINNKYYIRTIRAIQPMEELFLKYTFYKVV